MSKVFLVTDASWVANEVRAGLSLGEWDIKEISDPRLTTSLVMEERPEAVIVDMQVGTMGGMAVIRGIRGEVDEADRPRTVLLLDRSADEFIARRAGADQCVSATNRAHTRIRGLRGGIVSPSSSALSRP